MLCCVEKRMERFEFVFGVNEAKFFNYSSGLFPLLTAIDAFWMCLLTNDGSLCLIETLIASLVILCLL